MRGLGDQELFSRVMQLEAQLARSDVRISEMTRVVAKLASFKQTVMESLTNDDDGDDLQTGVNGAAGNRPALAINGTPNGKLLFTNKIKLVLF